MNARTPQLSPAEMDELSRLAFNIAHNDKTREHFALLVNAVDPQTAKGAFGDIIVKRQLDAFRKEMQDERQKESMSRVLEANERQKGEVLKRFQNVPDIAAKLDAIRTQYGVGDWNAAALIYAGSHPPENPALKPPPEIANGTTWDFPTVPGPDGKMLEFRDYVKDPRKYSNNLATQMITDFKRGHLPSAFQGY